MADVIEKLTPTEDHAAEIFRYRWGQEKFGAHWCNADLLTGLWAACTFIRPASYLEIGVRRGQSSVVVAATTGNCDIYGFDLWLEDYGGAPNPGPDFVRNELRAVDHTGSLTLVSGDSRETVPDFLRRHRDLFFDLITIDGDHSVVGFAADLANTLPRLKVGGIVLSDDMPLLPVLRRVWKKIIQGDSRYVSWDFADAGAGVATAIRISDQPAAHYLY